MIVMRRLLAVMVLSACGTSEPQEDCLKFLADGSCETYGMLPPPTEPKERDDPAKVCERFNSEVVIGAGGPFSRGTSSCDPGGLTPSARMEVARSTNYIRWLAGLGPVTFFPEDSMVNARSQACASMMSNAAALSHFPEQDWPCYSAPGAQAASESNLGVGSLTLAWSMGRKVADFFIDPGQNNVERVGHRRWLLSVRSTQMGYGYHESLQTGSWAHCYNVQSGPSGSADGLEAVAYPNGLFPIELITSPRFLIPWSVSLPLGTMASEVNVELLSVGCSGEDDGGDGGEREVAVPLLGAWINRDRFGDRGAVIFVPETPPTVGCYRAVITFDDGSVVLQRTELISCGA